MTKAKAWPPKPHCMAIKGDSKIFFDCTSIENEIWCNHGAWAGYLHLGSKTLYFSSRMKEKVGVYDEVVFQTAEEQSAAKQEYYYN